MRHRRANGRRTTGVAAALAFLLALAAPHAGRAQDVPADVLVVGQVAEPKSLDPQVATATNDFRIDVNLYDGLVRFRPGTLEVEPALAESWTISEDGKTYTFKLREGVTFHDGAPFDANAVKFTFDRMLKPDHPFHGTGPFPLAFFFESVANVDAVDPTTVRFTLNEPFAPLLSNLAYPTGLIVSPAAVERHGREYGRHPSGTGPFVFRLWESNRQVALERNPNYWDGAPPLRGVVFRPITDDNARSSEMLAGGIDLMTEVPPDSLQVFRDDPDNYAVHERAGPHLWFLILNTREKPFDDKRVRQAVNFAINRETLTRDVLQGTATPASGPVPAAFAWAHDATLKPYPHDVERAKALLAEAGYPNGVDVTLLATESGSGMLAPLPMATSIQADLRQAGIRATIETFEWNAYLERVNAGLKGPGVMAEMAWMTNDPDTLPYLALRSDATPDKGGFNSGYYSNPEVDTLLEQARSTTDRAERATLYKRMQRIVYDDAPWAFVANWKQNAITTTAVKDFALQPSFLLDLRKVRKEQ